MPSADPKQQPQGEMMNDPMTILKADHAEAKEILTKLGR